MTCKKNNVNVLILLVLLVMLVLNLLIFFKKDAAWQLETIKVWGPENMKAVQELYQSETYVAQQTAAIDQALAQLPAEEVNVDENMEENTEENNEPTKSNDDMISKVNEIKNSAVVHGNKDARFTILEYSELLCPYCKRQSDQGTIDSVLEEYPEDVNAIFRNFIVHGAAAKLGEGIECVGELWEWNDHHDFIKNTFATDGTVTEDVLINVAKDLWIDGDAMKECLDSGRYTQTVQDQTQEWRNLFGVSGTPGNVIVDNESGEFVLIPGAYPPEKFIEEIEKMMN